MKKFLRYLPNGKILSVNVCSSDDFHLQPGYPDSLIEIDINDMLNISLYQVCNKKIQLIPEKPNEFSVFNYDLQLWVDDWKLADTYAKTKRESLLINTDWTQLSDIPLATKEKWIAYRQFLRDITSQPGYPFDVAWPTPPQ